MKIKNEKIEEFATFLLSLSLKGKENRMRNRFVKVLQKRLEECKKEHTDLLEDYCKKKEDGSFQTVSQDGKTFYDVEDVQGFNKEYQILMNEEFVIDSTGNNKEMFETVKDTILNCDKEFSGREALQYETYCELFETENENQTVTT